LDWAGVQPEVRNLIDHAAELTGKTRIGFVLDAVHQAAHIDVLDQDNSCDESQGLWVGL
jgi:uncharacterized protein (DUF1778 family)